MLSRRFAFLFAVLTLTAAAFAGKQQSADGIKHSFLVTGGETYIVDENDEVIWKYPSATRDGWVLPSGNILLCVNRQKDFPGGGVIEVTRENKVVFSWKSSQNGETHSVQPLENGNLVIVEGGPKPRLVEIDREGKEIVAFALQCQVPNIHMQTRMARKLADGTYLAPHLLDFAVKQYDATGKVIGQFDTTVEGDKDHKIHTWPFTAIRLKNGNTVVGLTHGNRVVEFDKDGKIIWQVSNDDLPGEPIKDACGVQRLPNGNTMITAYAGGPNATKLMEVTPEKKIVWSYTDDKRHGIHHFQILTTNGKRLEGAPLK
ncbi:MAG: hypothetical protein WD768_03725 [Phycisphaeraceae bacterium]